MSDFPRMFERASNKNDPDLDGRQGVLSYDGRHIMIKDLYRCNSVYPYEIYRG